MAYGTEDGVTLLIGGTDAFFTAAKIAAAIVSSDVVVDLINDGASAAKKTLASNIIAKNILMDARVNKQLKGLMSDGGGDGRPGKSAKEWKYVTPDVLLLLEEMPTPSFKKNSPDAAGEFT